jgi:superfamily II DNA or RNA helicase
MREVEESHASRVRRQRQALEQLEPWQLELLGVLLLHGPLRAAQWFELSSERGVPGPRGRALTSADLERARTTINQRGFHVAEPYRHATIELSVPSEIRLTLLEILHARQRLDPLATVSSNRGSAQAFSRAALPIATAMRVAIARGDPEDLATAHKYVTMLVPTRDLGGWMITVLGLLPTARQLAALPEALAHAYLSEFIAMSVPRLWPLERTVLDAALAHPNKSLRLEAGRLLILRGEVERALALTDLPKYGREGLLLLAAFWSGDYEGAVEQGAAAIASMKTRKRKALPGLEGICHVLANLATCGRDPSRLQSIGPVLASMNPDGQGSMYTLSKMRHALLGERANQRPCAHIYRGEGSTWLDPWLCGVHDAWFGLRRDGKGHQGKQQDVVSVMRSWAEHAQTHGFGPLARELEATADALADLPRSANAPISVVSALRVPDPWEAALAGLEALAEQAQVTALASKTDGARRRLVWEWANGSIEPRVLETSRTRKGRKISLARLLAGEEAELLTEHDRRVLTAAEPDSPYGTPRMVLRARAMLALIDHPGVVDVGGDPVRIERGRSKLRTTRKAGGVFIELVPAALEDHDVVVVQTEPTRVVIYERTPELARAAEIVRDGLAVPKQGVEQLARVLTRLSVVAGIEIGGDLEPEAEQVEADARPLLLLEWDGATLLVRARVAPLGLGGVHVPPGVGNVAISVELHEAGRTRLLRAERDLSDERRRLAELGEACPTLTAYGVGLFDWRVTELADALEVMTEIGRQGDAVVLAWPKGRALQPPVLRELGDLTIQVKSGAAWLEVLAGLELDDGVVLGFRELIEARAGTRFVALGEDRFVALSEQLRRRIDALRDLGTQKGEAVRTSPAMLPVLEELAEGLVERTFDTESLARLERLREVAGARPRLPRGFRAKLRDYQKDGYAWMWRLAEVGLGACLADDMGLGKTVQALALLQQRANKGPALVVCPTSVVHNWVAETSRFAPSLRASVLGSSTDRGALLEACGRNDVIVCSYGVLASEAEALAEVEFSTAVFDEAHALKNHDTKRAQAAQKIRAEFRLGLTGTPVENRVEELWGVFRVLVPGLLGSKAHFDERFAKTIAKGEREHAATLRAIVRHFILRRTKSQVLDELPPRTEITVLVPQHPKEQAYYEALRQRAVEKLGAGDPRKKRFRVLAEITRLRQAAVDPRLLDEHAAPAGAKLDAALEHVLALREEGHRALVFTQFLGSMALLRQRFDAAGIEYLELDGSTPAAERARRVEAFQRGEGDVFVLSLRAGGVGMNLTGADYVLHIDPWWNPAVEDQATDRAHRIGQTRPVTVYRLVTRGTIEEKILALHERKRDLADDILSGLEGSDALDLDELIGLLG